MRYNDGSNGITPQGYLRDEYEKAKSALRTIRYSKRAEVIDYQRVLRRS